MSSAGFVEANAVASRSWLAWLLTPRAVFGARHTWLILPYGGGRALKVNLPEAQARAALAAAQALLALALVAFVACALRPRWRRAAGGAVATGRGVVAGDDAGAAASAGLSAEALAEEKPAAAATAEQGRRRQPPQSGVQARRGARRGANAR